MSNKPLHWHSGESEYIDLFWIAYFSPMTEHIEYFKHSLTGKVIYSIGYAKYCLNQYANQYPDYKLWIEPAYIRIH